MILDERYNIGTHWIVLYALYNNNVTHFHSFGVEHIPEEIKKFIDRSLITTNIYRMQAHNSKVCKHFYIGLIDFMLKAKTLTDISNVFSANSF